MKLARARLVIVIGALGALTTGCAWTAAYPDGARVEAERVAAAVCPDGKYEAADTSYVSRSTENLPSGLKVYSYRIICSEPYSGPVETPKNAFAGALEVDPEGLRGADQGANAGAWSTVDRQPSAYISVNFADSREIVMNFSVDSLD